MAEEPGILEDDPSEQLISPANVIAVIRLCWMYLERSGLIPVVHRREAREGDDRRRVREKTRQRNSVLIVNVYFTVRLAGRYCSPPAQITAQKITKYTGA